MNIRLNKRINASLLLCALVAGCSSTSGKNAPAETDAATTSAFAAETPTTLSAEDIEKVVQWIDAGAELGKGEVPDCAPQAGSVDESLLSQHMTENHLPDVLSKPDIAIVNNWIRGGAEP